MRYFVTVFLFCLTITGFTPSIWAQDNIDDTDVNDVIEDNLETDKVIAREKALGELNKFRTRVMPQKWSIKSEVQTIEKSLGNYDPLIQSLEEANNDLKSDLAAYLKNPGDQVLAARITAKMSSYAKKIVWDVDKITGDQDVLLSVFNELNRKLDKFSGYLDYKVSELDSQVERYRTEGKELEAKLIKLSRQIKHAKDKREKEQYTREFRRIFSKFNINNRYEQGLVRNREDYATLSKNLKSLIKMFAILNQAFTGLIESLEAEKNYLLDNIRLQADTIRVQKLVHEGISDGSRAVTKVTKKLALLYAKVEGFTKVHEKINRDLAKFGDTSRILGSLVKEIDKAPFQAAPTVDKAIDYFYSLGEKDE